MSKSKEYFKTVAHDRDAWKSEMQPFCMWCNKSAVKCWPGLEIHEIERRSAAPSRWGHRCNYLLLCPDCHSLEFSHMSHDIQLALKLFRDPRHFSLEDWLQIKDPELRAPERITSDDIIAAMRAILCMQMKT